MVTTAPFPSALRNNAQQTSSYLHPVVITKEFSNVAVSCSFEPSIPLEFEGWGALSLLVTFCGCLYLFLVTSIGCM